jgi:hypothetical protein
LLHLERVGRHDNFFALGGHSLLAVQVVTRLRQILGVEAAIRDLFAYPVLSDFAALLIDIQLRQIDPQDIANLIKLIQL